MFIDCELSFMPQGSYRCLGEMTYFDERVTDEMKERYFAIIERRKKEREEAHKTGKSIIAGAGAR